LILAFKDYKLSKGIWGSAWVGLDNFKMLLDSPQFITSFKNSLILNFYRLVWGFPMPIVLALVLNEVRLIAYKRIAQTIVYLPHFISWVIIAGMAVNLFSASEGIVNIFLKNIGLDSIPFLNDPRYFRSTLIGIEVWKEVGWGTIIYLAALTAINPEQYEAAIVDGASRLQRILYITVPGITSTIAILLILRVGNLMRAGFEQIILLYNPMVYEVADVLETFAYRNGVLEGRYSYATALGLIQSVLSMVLVLSANRLSKKISGESLY
jgi:putative aldouronate transport system permease protein